MNIDSTETKTIEPRRPRWPILSSNGRSATRPSMFTLRMEPGILDYTKHGPDTVQEVFNEAASHIHDMASMFGHDQESFDGTDDALIDQMAKAIFGSNMIERVGCGLDETLQLCKQIFRDEQLPNIPSRSTEYRQRLEAYIQANTNTQNQRKIRERREVINHATAFMHMVHCVIHDQKPFSEDIIRETHAILCSGIPVETRDKEVIHSNKYAGQYRTRHVSAGNTNFVTPNRVNQAMKRFIDELNTHLLKAEKEQLLDPFFIAANACSEFVMIHPFLDGNGRTCRMILNTILLKYAGIVCPIGEHDSERPEYIAIMQRRSTEECGNGEFAWYTLKRCMLSFKRLRDRLTKQG